MLKNYFLVIFRNLYKNRVFTLINIIGLGLALSVCIVAFFNHMFNYEFDRNNENFESIYRVTSFRDMQGREQEYGVVPATLGLQVGKDIPGIKSSARIARSGSPVKVGNDVYSTQVSYVDPEFFDIFSFKLIYGDKKSIESQNNVFISKKMAERLFGNEYPVGKTLSIINEKNKEFPYRVGAVFDDLPLNCSFRIDILTHYDNFLLMWEQNDADWKFLTTALFVQITDKTLVPSVSGQLRNYLAVQNEAREDFKINRWVLIPLKDVGAKTREIWSSGLVPSLHPAAVVAPPVMAIFILLIACFNFANTSIATFSRRLKEIGLRKTFGGQRRQLIIQFMFETLIICLLALFTGILLAEFLVPAYSSLWAYMSIELTFTKYPLFWLFLVILLAITGFLAGVYPALHVSRYSPVNVIRGTSGFKGSGRFSLVLLTLQFTISVASLVLGISFSRNAVFQRTVDLGYDRDNLIIMPVPAEYYTSFRNDILSNPMIVSAEGTRSHIGYGAYRRSVKDEDKQLEVDFLDVGPGYPSTMGLRLVDGRLFDRDRVEADRGNRSVIVNKKLVAGFGWTDPVGKEFTFNDTVKYRVIGLVQDFYTNGMWQAIEPTVIKLADKDEYYNMAVRGRKEDLPAILEFLSARWKSMGTNFVFGGRLQEDTLEEEKSINDSILKVNLFLAVSAMLLSLIGMYNLVSLDIIKKTKEIGIRKIQGAPAPLLMYITGRKFLVVVLIASVLGCGLGYYLSVEMLDSIWDYYVNIGAAMLLSSAFIMIAATTLTVIFKIASATMKNPVVTLRYE
jgi:ABC-type antimicrobial peptide transport system permease subunit